MYDDNWDGISGDSAHRIEVANAASQVNLIEAFVEHYIYHNRHHDGIKSAQIHAIIQELHKRGTLFLLVRAGQYRVGPVIIQNSGKIVYTPPACDEVPDLVETFGRELERHWKAFTPVEVAAYCLWMINWIHPFDNGNGRTARAFSYACLCLKAGFWLPGTSTLIDKITENKPAFEAALRFADESYSATGKANLSMMNEFVERLVFEQLREAGLIPS